MPEHIETPLQTLDRKPFRQFEPVSPLIPIPPQPKPEVEGVIPEDLFIEFEENALAIFGDSVSDVFTTGGTRTFAENFNANQTFLDIAGRMDSIKTSLDNNRQYKIALIKDPIRPLVKLLIPGTKSNEEEIAAINLEFSTEFDSEYQELIQQSLTLEQQINRTQFKLDYWKSLPIMWRSGDWTSFEQSLTAQIALGIQRPAPADFTPPQIGDILTTEDIIELEAWFDDISSAFVQIPGKAKLVELRDAYEKKARPRVVVLDVLTTEEIIKNMTTLAVPDKIPGISPEQVLALLSQFEGDSDLQAQLEDGRIYVQDLAQQYTAERLMRNAILTGLIDPTLPRMTTLEYITLAASQPIMWLTHEVLESFFAHTTQPWVARLIRTGTLPGVTGAQTAAVGAGIGGFVGARFGLPGRLAGMKAGAVVGGALGVALGGTAVVKYRGELTRLYEESIQSQSSYWMADSEAWQNWNQNTFIKIGLETFADPTLLFGMGIFTKATAKIPYVGRYLGMPEAIFNRVTNAAFRMVLPARAGVLPILGGGLAGYATYQQTGNLPLSIGAGVVGLKLAGSLYAKVPNTIEQMASKTGKDLLSMTIRLSQDRVGPLAGVANPRIMDIPISAIRETLDEAVKIHRADPALGLPFNNYAQLGRAVFDAGNRWIDKESIKPLLAKLFTDTPLAKTSPLIDAQVRFADKDSLTSINDILYWLRGSDVKNITNNESVEMLARLIGGDKGSVADRLKVVTKWVDDWLDDVYAKGTAAIRVGDSSAVGPALKSLGDNAVETFLINARSDAMKFAQSNAWIRSSQRHMDRMGQMAGLNYVERNIVYPFSRMVLLTLTYGVLNITENGFRSYFAGVNPLVPRDIDAVTEWIRMSVGTKNRPIGFEVSAMDEQLHVIDVIAAVPASAGEATYGVAKTMEGSIPFITKDISSVVGMIPGVRGTRIERWSRKIPAPLQSMASLNRWAGRTGMIQQAWYLQNKFGQNIERLFPAESALVTEAHVPLLGRGLEGSFSKKQIENMERAMLRRKVVGTDDVLAMQWSSTTDLEAAKYMFEISEALSRVPGLDLPFQHSIMKAAPGWKSLDDVNSFMDRFFASWSEASIVGKSSSYLVRMRDYFQQMSAYSPKNMDEMLAYGKELTNLINSMVGEQGVANNLFEMVIRRSDELTRTVDRRTLWTESTELLQSMVDDLSRQTNFQIQVMEDTLQGQSTISLEHIRFQTTPGVEQVTRELLVELPRSVREQITMVKIGTPSLDIPNRTLTVSGAELTTPQALLDTKRAVYKELLAVELEKTDEFIPELMRLLDEDIATTWADKWGIQNYTSEEALEELMDLLMVNQDTLSALSSRFPARSATVQFEDDFTNAMMEWLNLERERALVWADPVNSPTAAQIRFHQDVFVSKAGFRNLTESGRRANYLAKLGEVRSSWDKWRATNSRISFDQQNLAGRMAGLSGGIPEPLNIRRPVTGRLSLNDVTYLWGGEFANADNLINKMIDPGAFTMQQKEEFIRQHLTKATLTAGNTAKAAEYGFTPESLGDVYDALMRSLSLDPGSVEYFTPAVELFRGIRNDMQGIFTTHAVADDSVDVLNSWIKDNHTAMLKTGLYDKTPSIDLIPGALTKDDGSPLILYHGSATAKIAEEGVDVTKGGGNLGEGFYADTEVVVANEFSDRSLFREPDLAFLGADDAPNITPVVFTPKNLVKAEEEITQELVTGMLDGAVDRIRSSVRGFIDAIDDTVVVTSRPNQAEARVMAKALIATNPGKLPSGLVVSASNITTDNLTSQLNLWKEVSLKLQNPNERNLHMIHEAIKEMNLVVNTFFDDFSYLVSDNYFFSSSRLRSSDVIIREVSLANGIDAVSSPNIVEGPWSTHANAGAAGTVEGSGREYVAYSNDIVVSQFDERIMTGPSRWDDIRESSMDETIINYQEDFPDYTNMNALDQAFKSVYPFWIYENQRWPWLIRNAVQKPGATAVWGRYNSATDGGYMPIPGTDLQGNPTRGTVWSGGLRRLYQRDFPEYADTFEQPVELLDMASRWGFYVGFHIAAPIAIMGGKSSGARPQIGELLPPFATTMLSALASISPNSDWTNVLLEQIFPDRFRDYRTSLAVSDAGGDGPTMLSDIKSGTELSEEDQAMWVQARQRILTIAGILDAQFSLFRFRPEEMTIAYDASKKGFAELTGVSVEDQEKMQRRFSVTGTRASDVFPLDPLDQYVMREVLEKYDNWLSSNIAPLLPSTQGDIAFKTTSFFNEQTKIWEAARTDGFWELNEDTGQLELRYKSLDQLQIEWASGKISVREWESAVQATQSQGAIRSQALGEINYYKDVPKTRTQREDFFIRFDIPIPTYSAGQELLWAYYDIRPKLELNEDGVMRVNWERYFMEIDVLLESMLPTERDRLLARIQADWTDSQRLRWADSRDYLRAYKNVSRVVKAEFTPDEQIIIEKFLRSDSPERERIRKEVETEDGKLIVTYESHTQNFRRNLRLTNPMLDAKLLFWDEVQKPLTLKARELANELIALHRPGASLFTVDIE